MREGAGHFPQRSVALPVNRLAEFVHGVCLPFHLLRDLWADQALRRYYLKVGVLQAVTIVGLAVLFTGSGKEAVETVGPGEWSERHQEEVARELEEARAELEEAEAGMEKLRKLQKVAEDSGMLAGMAGADEEKVRAAVEHALTEAQAAEDRRQAARDAAEAKREQAEKLEGKHTVRRVIYWAALLSMLQFAQWIVIALSRDFHTVIEREASLRTGLVPEDEPLTPRVRLNMPWVRTKMRRRWRGMVLFVLGAPVLWLCTRWLPWRDEVLATLMSLWGAWWFVVFTAGKSALAWKEETAGEPWFLRGWNGLTSRIPGLRAYGSLWTNQTREVFSPAASVERRPWSLMGLAVVRALSSLPLVRCFLRPLIPVAAAHLLVRAAPAAPEGLPSTEGTVPVP
ncbi:hypothetical protein KYC5002_21100 [Archangium violaceum]|uniref:hypothetical protein n=1 Tax=Archangium violaceum TaxID=83451 RepID=UPI002B2F33F4|nr:hypothetical protein KYC5002_21100 [Archangium gephyra]